MCRACNPFPAEGMTERKKPQKTRNPKNTAIYNNLARLHSVTLALTPTFAAACNFGSQQQTMNKFPQRFKRLLRTAAPASLCANPILPKEAC